MYAKYRAFPVSHAQSCRIAEALCEGFVRAMQVEFEAAPDGEFPCCVRCGGFCVHEERPLCPSSATPLVELLGDKDKFAPWPSPCRTPGDTGAPVTAGFRVSSPREIVRTGGGTTIELSCYQAALKRMRGTDPGCRVVVVECEPGTFRAAVLNSELHEDEAKRGIIDDPVVHANSQGTCPCGAHSNNGASEHHHDDEAAEETVVVDEWVPPAEWGVGP